MPSLASTARVTVAKEKTPKAATPAPKPSAAVSEPVVATGKFRGKGTCAHLGIPAGLRRMEFQDRLLALGLKKTDVELAAMMDAEHPGGVKIRPDHMRAIRRLYNEGTHTKAGTVPEVKSVEYNAAGEVVPERRGRKVVVTAA